MLIASCFILLIGLVMTAYVVFIKARGAFSYWIRPYHDPECWALGRYLPFDQGGEAQALVDANAALRSADKRSSSVIREWDKEKQQLFIGVIVTEKFGGELPNGLEFRHYPSRQVLRLSGENRSDETTRIEAINQYAEAKGLTLDHSKPSRLSGQSFRLYQWQITSDTGSEPTPLLREIEERTLQLRDSLSFTILLTVVSIGLLGTRQPVLFAAGMGLIILLSGACKFVFLHQRADEAEEIHLQNY